MAASTITYFWKQPRPTDERFARALMAAAYATAVATDANVTQILIRSYIHATTRKGDRTEPDRPHITIAVKNAETQRTNSHEASHGYTSDKGSTEVIDVSPSYSVKSDHEYNVWPKGLRHEVVHGDPAKLEEDFVSRSTSEEESGGQNASS